MINMQYIKTPIGIISVDDPAKVLSQKQYDDLSNKPTIGKVLQNAIHKRAR